MLESGSWGHSVLQTPALVIFLVCLLFDVCFPLIGNSKSYFVGKRKRVTNSSSAEFALD